MLPLKMVVAEKVVLVVLVDLIVEIFQTYLKIFLVTLEVVEEALEEETQIIEVLI